MTRSAIVLVPSPLTTSFVWLQVAAALTKEGVEVVIPSLDDDASSTTPFWLQHVASVRQAIEPINPSTPVLLVGHSGAGPMLPALADGLSRPIGGYIFVDAGLPEPGKTRLDMMPDEFRQQLREHLESGGRFPDWTEEDLEGVLPDFTTRRALLAALRPRDLRFFQELMPVSSTWPDVPCGYLLFSESYSGSATEAKMRGWLFREITGGHFHMLVDPDEVAAALIGMAAHLDRS